MSSTSREWWNEISPYLDEVLEVPEGERGAWLASLREAQPSIAAQLETLLSEHDALAKENFLEQRAAWVQEPELAGQSLGPYKLLHAIGHGGMGSVWLAERSDGRFDRRVAVKFLSIALVGGGGKERFKREGSILGRLVHPHITELLDAGVSETGYPYLVLEHVDGQPIDVYCDQHQLSVRDRLRLFLDVLAAAAHAHANLIVHRDLKPSNVLVSNQGQVKLLDFGIAKLLEEGPEGSATLLTREHGGALTPEYAAPEQLTGRPVTTATDIYALGLLLYVLLAGRHPIGPGQHSPAELVKAIADTEPLPLSEVATRKTDADNPAEISANRGTTPDKLSRVLRGDLDTIVAKALKKNPQERYSSVAAFADDIQRYLDNEPISARPDTVRYRVVKFVNRNRTTVVLAAVALVALLAGAVATLVQAHRAREQRDFAFRQLSRAEAINDLNNFLLSDAAPSGKPFTVNELLDRAEHIVRREHADDATQVELLISIGGQYSSLDEEAKASSVLEEAYQSSRNLSDPSIRAQAACALGATLAKQSELDRAEALYREGMKELPDAPQYSLDRYYCLKRGARIAAEQGASAEPVARAEAALHVLETSPLASDRLRFSAYMDLGEAYRAAGRYREAIAAFQKTSVFMTALG
ncbi:MAG: protein kinase, partial [Acidobacteria bacterium]|nr:protein kinase [Acidobacteriota bacterium]